MNLRDTYGIRVHFVVLNISSPNLQVEREHVFDIVSKSPLRIDSAVTRPVAEMSASRISPFQVLADDR